MVAEPPNGAAAVNQSLIWQTAPTIINLGLVVGGVYEISMFHAERPYCGSNFKLTIRNFLKPRTECLPTCGDGVATTFEECDDGTANSDTTYGGCRTDCTLGPYCSDNIVQTAPACPLGPHCGDGIRQAEYDEYDDGNTSSNDRLRRGVQDRNSTALGHRK